MSQRAIFTKVLVMSLQAVLLSSTSCAQEPPAASREFIRATIIGTKFDYTGDVLSAVGIPSGAKFVPEDKSTVVASAEGTEMIDEDGERRIKVKIKLTPRGKIIATITAQFKPTGMGAKIRKAIINDAWESRYIYEGDHAALFLSLPRIETYDLKSGKKVAETRNIKILGNGLFSGEELCYQGDKVVFHSSFVRHAGTGLLVEEKVNKGKLPRDYHHYELVMMDWPDGSRW